MRIEAPQLIYLALVALSVGICLARLGEPKRGTYSFMDVLVSPALAIGLLYWGGFFS